MFYIVPLTSDDMTSVLGYAGDLIGDLMPLLVVIIGISIGAYVIKVILHLRG